MIITSWWAIFLAAFCGGCIGEFLTLYEESRNSPAARVKGKRDGYYWLGSIGMALAGGFIAIAYGFKEVHIFAAINIGASAPVLIKSGFASFAPASNQKIN
jgi:hypothetical protein